MPSPTSDTPEAALLRDWVDTHIVPRGAYDLSHVGETSLLHTCSFRGSFLIALIDGLSVSRPTWSGGRLPPSEVLFRGLSEYFSETPSHLVQLLHHDGCYWEIRRVDRVPSEPLYLPHLVTLVHLDPAEQGGATIVLLLADDHRSAVAFADCPYSFPPYPEGFSIAFHGDDERRDQIFRHLEAAAVRTTTTPL